MNTGQVNGSALNGTSNPGNNATLTGGFAAACILAGAIIGNCVLSGGIFNTPATGGNVSAQLGGGVNSSAQVGGGWFITTLLSHGIHSQSVVDSIRMRSSPGLVGGIHSASSYGGQMLTRVRLQMISPVGDSTQVGSRLNFFSGMRGGINGTSYVSGLITGGTFLGAGGVHSTSGLGGVLLHTDHARLNGGFGTKSDMGGRLLYSIKLIGGILVTHSVGKELDIQALLQNGITNVGGLSTHPMRISPKLNSGMGSYSELGAKVKLSPFSNGGVSSTSVLGGVHRISAKLQNGMSSTNTHNSNGISASQKLRGGLESTSTSDAKLRTHIRLKDGIVSAGNSLGGDIVEGFRDPLLNNWALSIVSATVLLEIFTPESDT